MIAEDPSRQEQPLLRVQGLRVQYEGPSRTRLNAVDDVSFDLWAGETLGLVGESGSGKSTIARSILRHVRAESGTASYGGRDLLRLTRRELRTVRAELQMIFQDPISSLSPRRPIERIVGEGLRIRGTGTRGEQRAQIREVMESVGLHYAPERRRRRSQLSGGQCQRVSIARALAMRPKLLICDEPVSALDVSVQAQILNVLQRARVDYGLSMLFISHDLAVVRHMSDRIAVLYGGRICESGPAAAVLAAPRHPYTRELLDASAGRRSERMPAPGRPAASVSGSAVVPADEAVPHSRGEGCGFRLRCPYAEERCAVDRPRLTEHDDGTLVACHFPLQSRAAGRTP